MVPMPATVGLTRPHSHWPEIQLNCPLGSQAHHIFPPATAPLRTFPSSLSCHGSRSGHCHFQPGSMHSIIPKAGASSLASLHRSPAMARASDHVAPCLKPFHAFPSTSEYIINSPACHKMPFMIWPLFTLLTKSPDMPLHSCVAFSPDHSALPHRAQILHWCLCTLFSLPELPTSCRSGPGQAHLLREHPRSAWLRVLLLNSHHSPRT